MEKKKAVSSNRRDVANLAPSYGPILFQPGPPNSRVATAGECECHPVLPVNYTVTKLIVCLVHTKKNARLAIDGSIVSTQMQSSFSHRLDLMLIKHVNDESTLSEDPVIHVLYV